MCIGFGVFVVFGDEKGIVCAGYCCEQKLVSEFVRRNWWYVRGLMSRDVHPEHYVYVLSYQKRRWQNKVLE